MEGEEQQTRWSRRTFVSIAVADCRLQRCVDGYVNMWFGPGSNY